jgi:hypothetical protein
MWILKGIALGSAVFSVGVTQLLRLATSSLVVACVGKIYPNTISVKQEA